MLWCTLINVLYTKNKPILYIVSVIDVKIQHKEITKQLCVLQNS